MDIQAFRQAVYRARLQGYIMENVEMQPGIRVYQLKNADGEYVQFGQSPEKVWEDAFKNGVLPPEEESKE